MATHVQDYAIRLALATHPEGPFAPAITNQYIRWGSSPRGAQTLVLAAKVRALLDARYNVSFEDLRRVYLPSLRHRVLLNFEAQAEGIDTDEVLLKVLDTCRRRLPRTLRLPRRVRAVTELDRPLTHRASQNAPKFIIMSTPSSILRPSSCT